MWVATNHKPRYDKSDPGMARKVWFIPFEYQIPEESIQPNFHEELLGERPGILAWMVEGCRQYVAAGRELSPPTKVKPEYVPKPLDLAGQIDQFLADCTVAGDWFEVPKEHLRRKFLDYAEQQEDWEVFPESRFDTAFGRQMSGRGFNKGEENPRQALTRLTVYQGLRLKTLEEQFQRRYRE